MPLTIISKLFLSGSVSSYESLSDEELMKLLLEQNTLAFDTLYCRYKDPLYSYFRNLTNATLAEEMLQETFIKILNKKETYRFEGSLKSWIWIIARNTLRDFWRSTEHKMKNSFQGLTDETGEELLKSNVDSAEDILLAKVTKQTLLECAEKLPIQQKEIIFLHLQSELSNQEIADMTGVKLGAVKSVLFRSKEKLIECFKRKGHHAAE